jgi:hypothetical protein
MLMRRQKAKSSEWLCVLHHLSSIAGRFSCKDAIAITSFLGGKKFDAQWVG